MILRDVTQYGLVRANHTLSEQFDSFLVTKGENGAELENVNQSRVVNWAVALPLGSGACTCRRRVLRFDRNDHVGAVVFRYLAKERLYKGLEAFS